MKWIRKSFLWLSAGCLSATAAAQEPARTPAAAEAPPSIRAVSLGRPAPLPEDTPVVNAFVPIRADAPSGVVPASHRVVRAMSSMIEDEPGNVFLPKQFAPGDLKLPLLPDLPG